MAGTFQCPTCGAPLDYPGTGDTMRCPFCNSSVIVPQELRQQAQGTGAPPLTPGGTAPVIQIGGQTLDLSHLMQEAIELKEVMNLVRSGQDEQAMALYSQITNSSPDQARTVIEAMKKHDSVAYSSIMQQVNSQAGRQISIEQQSEILRLMQSGQKIEAIKLYRQATGAGLAEAKIAVEVMQATGQFPSTGVPAPIYDPLQQTKKKSSPCGCLLGWILALVFVGAMLLVVFAVLPESLQTQVGDTFAQYLGSFAYANLRLTQAGSSPGMFGDIRGITADPQGNIYVADYKGGRIQVFNASGKFIRLWNIQDPKAYVEGLALDRHGVVYALYKNDIYRYDAATGKALEPLPLDEKIREDFRTIDGMALSPNDQLVITNNQDVAVLDLDGKTVRLLQKPLQAVTEDTSFDLSVAADSAGDIYILDRNGNKVYKFSQEGKYLSSFGGSGESAGLFYYPYSIAVDARDRVFVGDSGRIQVFDGDGKVLGKMDVTGVAYQMGFDGKDQLVATVNNQVLRFVVKQ